jgi:hypothetical protein
MQENLNKMVKNHMEYSLYKKPILKNNILYLDNIPIYPILSTESMKWNEFKSGILAIVSPDSTILYYHLAVGKELDFKPLS